MRAPYRDRTPYLGDPDSVKIPVRLLTSDDHCLRACADPA